MKRIDVIFNGKERTFRTNESGDYLFIGISQNTQISCESGFNSLKRIKKAIREYLKSEWESRLRNHDDLKTWNEPMPRIKYIPSPHDTWKE
jgi:hypothetical protein